MALIKCNECGKEISDKATNCIHCGKKIITKKNSVEKTRKKTNKKSILVIGSMLFVLLIGITIFLFINHNSKSYVGKWEHNIVWKENGTTTRESYASFELFNNGTFNYVGYSKNSDDDKISYNGTYNENNGTIYLYFTYDNQDYTDTLYITDDKMCVRKENCEDYYVKSNSKLNNNIIVEENKNQSYIFYDDYQNILNNKENAIIVVVMENCKYCDEYEETIKQISDNYSTPIYYYELDEENKLNVEGTPTTLLIKNGEIANTISGKTDYEDLTQKLNNLGLD